MEKESWNISKSNVSERCGFRLDDAISLEKCEAMAKQVVEL